MNKSVEKSLKRYLKRKIKFTLGVIVSFLICGSVGYGEINEKPVADKQYDDFLYYDREVQIFEGNNDGEFFFNKGVEVNAPQSGGTATAFHLDGTNIFNIGSAEEKEYDGVFIGKTESINIGGSLTINASGNDLYFGSHSWDNFGDAATIYVDENSNLVINANNMHTSGGAETNLKLFDNATANINLTGDFVSDKGGTGIALQNFDSNSDTKLDINANNIRLSTVDGGAKRLAGLYLLGYNKGGSSDLIVKLIANNEISISGFERGITTFGSTNITLDAKTINIIADTEEGRGLNLNGYDAEKSTVIKIGSNEKTENINIKGGEYGIYAADRSDIDIISKNVNIEGIDGWGICLFSNSTTDITAEKTNIDGHIYSKDSDVNISSDLTSILGQVKALDGASINFSSKLNSTDGITQVLTDGTDAVVTTSDTTEQSIVDFNQNTVLNAYEMNGNNYVTDYHNQPYTGVATAIRANRNSVVNLNTEGNKYEIYGDIIAGRGIEDSNAIGGQINIGGTNTIIHGDILAGNTGKIDINLVGGNIEGRIDSYGDANLSNSNVFRPSEFDIAVTQAGQINLTLKDSVWTARHQSWLTKLDLDNSIVDLTKDEVSSVTIRDLSGSGTFLMILNSEDHSKGDMLYIGNGSGTHKVNIVGGITGGLENISEENPLRFATVQNSGGILEVEGAGIEAYTKEAGMYNLEYTVKKENFDPNDPENEKYNGGISGEGTYKPGNDFVENILDSEEKAENWIITGVSKQNISDGGTTIIEMAKSNYANAVYLDNLNKRLGDMTFANGDEGIWVRMRNDRIGEDEHYRLDNFMTQVGYDKKYVMDNGDEHRGIAFEYGKGTLEFKDLIGGETKADKYILTLYDTRVRNNGIYTDYTLRAGALSNDFTTYGRETGTKVTGEFKNILLGAGIEGGKRFDINENWYFEPQLQAQYTYVGGTDYTTNQGTKVDLSAIHSLIGRAGFRLGHDYYDENGKDNTIYIKADINREFLGDEKITAKDNTGSLDKTYHNDKAWYDIGLGATKEISPDFTVYTDIEKQFGKHRDNDSWQFNLGVRYRFNEVKDLNPVVILRNFSLRADNYFDFDKSELKPEGKAVIKKVSEELNRENVEGTIKIEGHTDWIGTREYNQKLSERRAKSVEEELKKNIVIDEIQYETKGYGEERPIADNSTKEGRIKNRRVDIKFKTK